MPAFQLVKRLLCLICLTCLTCPVMPLQRVFLCNQGKKKSPDKSEDLF